MLSIYRSHAVSESLLGEVARTEWLVDPVLFCYGVFGFAVLFVCTVGYFVLGGSWRRTERPARARRRVKHAAY